MQWWVVEAELVFLTAFLTGWYRCDFSVFSLYCLYPRCVLYTTYWPFSCLLLKGCEETAVKDWPLFSVSTKGEGTGGRRSNNEAKLQLDRFIGKSEVRHFSFSESSTESPLMSSCSGYISYALGTSERSGGLKTFNALSGEEGAICLGLFWRCVNVLRGLLGRMMFLIELHLTI